MDLITFPEDQQLLGDTKPVPTVTKLLETKEPIVSRSNGRGHAFKQVLASIVANLGTMNTGMAFGFSAVAIPTMLEDTSPTITITKSQSSWIASMSSAGTPFGCLFSGYLMDKIGRKATLVVTEVPLILGWILIATAVNVEMIYVGRFLMGFGSGMVGAPARVYTCEVSQPHLRGMLAAMAAIGVSTGVFFQYTIGSFVGWKTLGAISTSIPIISLITMLTMPESPNFLLTRNREDKAKTCLFRLRGMSCDVDDEILKMRQFKEKNRIEPLNGFMETFRALIKPSTLKPFAILSIYFFIYQWCGVNAITFYAVDIIKRSVTKITKTEKIAATISLGAFRVIFTVAGCIACRRYGRRPLTIISAVGCGVTMLSLGTYMYFLQIWETEKVVPKVTWFPILCIFLFMIASTLGFLIVPWVMIGEVYPTQVRGIVGGMTTCMAHGSVFFVVKTYQPLVDSIGQHGIFWLYGCISLLGLLFFWFWLPETKGRTLQEIEDYFCGRTKTLKPPKISTPSNNNVV